MQEKIELLGRKIFLSNIGGKLRENLFSVAHQKQQID